MCGVRRERTNTPLPAHAPLHAPQFLEAARHLADDAFTRGRKEVGAWQLMAEELRARPLTAKALAIVKGTLQEMQTCYANQRARADQHRE